MIQVSAHFAAWPLNKPIVTDAKTTDLASVLLLASLHGRSVHVTNVQSQDDIALIALSKEKDLKVTCDVSIYSLFLNRESFPGSTCLPTAKDQAALWENLETIDTFSVGTLPYRLATELGKPYSPRAGNEESTILLLSAINDGRLTMEDVTTRLSDNPRSIFDLPTTAENTYVEVEVDRVGAFPKRNYWSPLEGQTLAGAVHRVVLRGETVVLDGKFISTRPVYGQDISAFAGPVKSDRKQARFSMSSTRPSLQSLGFSSKPYDSNPMSPVPSSALIGSKSPKLGSKSPRLDGIDSTLQPSLMSLTSQQTALAAAAPQVTPTTLSATSTLTSLLASAGAAYARRHVLSVRAFSRDDLHALFGVASELRMLVERNIPIDILRGRVLCTAFYEPSTRTSCSFEAAMCRLGGSVVSVVPESSSVTKGESLADTVRTLGCYGDALVIRHPAAGSAQLAAKYSPVPVLNAGDGVGEHPTQVRPITFSFELTRLPLPSPIGLPRRLHHSRGARHGQRSYHHHGR